MQAPAPEPEPRITMPVLCPDEPLVILGDLHGCAELLDRFFTLRKNRFPEHRLIIAGDMLDRGANSAAVLARLSEESEAICLAGNHEEMLLAALDDPAAHGASWLRHGGLETMLSYGIRGLPRGEEGLQNAMTELRQRLGPEIEAWLRGLPLWWQSGNLVVSHAGLDPDLPPGAQTQRNLLWGHPNFGRKPRRDGLWVAYGHVIQDKASSHNGVIALDTGAYATGKLSFALATPGAPEPLVLARVP